MNWRRNLWSLGFGAMLSASSYTMVIPFLPLYLLDIGVSPENVTIWSGLVFSVSFFVAAVMAPYWGRLADKSGKRKMVLRAGISLAVVYFMGAFITNPYELLIIRVLQGFASGFIPAALAIVATSAPIEKMGFSLGIMQTAILIGGILGPLIGGSLSHLFGMRMSFAVAGAAIFLGTLLVKFLVIEPKTETASSESRIIDDFKMAFANRRLVEMMALLFAVQMASMALQPLVTLFIAELIGSIEEAGLTAGIVISLAGVAGAISAPMWGKFGQRHGFYKILVIAFIGAGLFNASQFLANNIYTFSLLQCMFGLFIVGVYPAINTIAVTYTDENFKGRLFGLMTTANQLGSMTGPLVGGVVSSWLGIRAVFLVTGGVLLALGMVLAIRNSKGDRAIQDNES
ncbi:Multidrug resistance protein MdtG [bioreactor metagenome]|uniref:Multidrug resistance protein MdtG n=1 Tax=bioreactor metagenome TaxID=1076179 RepID=A0A644TMB2_9ZZZZ|nr:MFS transporter [Negativicutes bacterium]